MMECFKRAGTVQSLYGMLIRSTTIGAKTDVFAFKRAAGIGSILDDFAFPFWMSVVTSSSDIAAATQRY